MLTSLHGGVNFRANAVFTIFALYLTLVCLLLHQICTEYIWCKSNFSCSEEEWVGAYSRLGAYSNKYGTSKTPLSISFNIQTRAPGSRSLKIGYALFFNPLLSVWISDETMPVVFDNLVFKLINYTWSWSQKPIK